WSLTRCAPSGRAGRRSPGNRGTPEAPTTTTFRWIGSRAAPSRWPGRAHGGCSSCCPTGLARPAEPRPGGKGERQAWRDQALTLRTAGADRIRAGRRRVDPRDARLAALDAALVRAPRRRDLDLHLREVAEGPQPRARPAGHADGRDRSRVRRAARSR